MRRDYFSIDFRGGSDGDSPTMVIDYDGPSGELRDGLTTASGTPLDASDIDVAFRHQRDTEQGVLSLTDRLTGAFIFEVSVPIDGVDGLVESASRADGDGEYAVRLTDGDGESMTYEKRTLLVYDHEGELLRNRSLIPGSVEL